MNLRSVGDCLRCVYCGAVLGGSSDFHRCAFGLRHFFQGVRVLVKVLGQFSIIYFGGLGLRIGVRVWVRVGVRVWVRVSVVLWSG